MTEQEQLKAMLSHADVHRPTFSDQQLEIVAANRSVLIHTGPDDATATFVFDEAGTLVGVSVEEA